MIIVDSKIVPKEQILEHVNEIEAKEEGCVICGESQSGIHMWMPARDNELFSPGMVFIFSLCQHHEMSTVGTDASLPAICEKAYYGWLSAELALEANYHGKSYAN